MSHLSSFKGSKCSNSQWCWATNPNCRTNIPCMWYDVPQLQRHRSKRCLDTGRPASNKWLDHTLKSDGTVSWFTQKQKHTEVSISAERRKPATPTRSCRHRLRRRTTHQSPRTTHHSPDGTHYSPLT